MTHRNHKDIHIYRLESLMLALAASISFITAILATGCNSRGTTTAYADAASAIDGYSAFLSDMRRRHRYTDTDLVSAIRQWRITDDSVSAAIVRDSMATETVLARYPEIRDSITDRFCEIICTRKRSFNDYLSVAMTDGESGLDNETLKLIGAGRRIYAVADSLPVYDSDSHNTIRHYGELLRKASETPFTDRDAVHGFLREEDRAFRSFLTHLPELGNIPLTEIRDDTRKIVGDIIALADGEAPLLSTTEAVVLLTLRNNRRLIQNAERCIEDIEAGRVRSGDQSTACMWMLLQPWLSFDRLSFSLLDEHQTELMRHLATKSPSHNKC